MEKEEVFGQGFRDAINHYFDARQSIEKNRIDMAQVKSAHLSLLQVGSMPLVNADSINWANGDQWFCGKDLSFDINMAIW